MCFRSMSSRLMLDARCCAIAYQYVIPYWIKWPDTGIWYVCTAGGTKGCPLPPAEEVLLPSAQPYPSNPRPQTRTAKPKARNFSPESQTLNPKFQGRRKGEREGEGGRREGAREREREGGRKREGAKKGGMERAEGKASKEGRRKGEGGGGVGLAGLLLRAHWRFAPFLLRTPQSRESDFSLTPHTLAAAGRARACVATGGGEGGGPDASHALLLPLRPPSRGLPR